MLGREFAERDRAPGLEQSLNDLANALDDLGSQLSSLETMLAMVMVPPSPQLANEACQPCAVSQSPARDVVDGQTRRVLNFRDKVASIRSNLDL